MALAKNRLHGSENRAHAAEVLADRRAAGTSEYHARAMTTPRPALRYLGKMLVASGKRATKGEGAWLGYTEAGVILRVAGAEDAPYPVLAVSLWRLVDHLAETMQVIERYAMSLPPDTRITFDARPKEAIAARDCGFEPGEFYCAAISVTRVDAPSTAVIDFHTALPDGYISFRTTLDAGRPGPITAVFS